MLIFQLCAEGKPISPNIWMRLHEWKSIKILYFGLQIRTNFVLTNTHMYGLSSTISSLENIIEYEYATKKAPSRT